jgi:tRNA pseudouridine38-40 synthase
MRNIKLIVAYDGTSYAGWQRQKDIATIQAVLEDSIGVMTREKNVVHGAGRTDAGVHALGMTAHFQTAATIPCPGFLKGLNGVLPEDIRVLSLEEVPPEFHARFNAVGKSYLYNFIIGSTPLPTERLYNSHLTESGTFNFSAVSACLEILLGKHDFRSFEAAGSRDPGNEGGMGAVREIFTARLHDRDQIPGHYTIEISGSGFLRHMVRNIVGTLFGVASGKWSVQEFAEILQAKDRSLAGATAPAKGLFLKEVFY